MIDKLIRGGYESSSKAKDEPKRQLYLDIIKAVAIIMVVFGHCIQFGAGREYLENADYFADPVFRFIYSFHMPLFMLVSGYFFAFSIKRYEIKELIVNRFKTLLIPIAVWSVPQIGVLILKVFLKKITGREALLQMIKTVLNNSWFLWAILFCSLSVLMVNWLLQDAWLAYVSILLFSLIVPDVLNLSNYKFMYPYFVAGYFWNKNAWFEKCKLSAIKLKRVILTCLIFSYGTLYSFYDYDSYIYTSKICIWKAEWLKQLRIDVFRWGIGFIGSAMILWLLYLLFDNNNGKLAQCIAAIGINSIGIYLMGDLVNRYILPRVTQGFQGVNYGGVLLETVFIVGVTYTLTKWIRKIPLLNRVLLGGR